MTLFNPRETYSLSATVSSTSVGIGAGTKRSIRVCTNGGIAYVKFGASDVSVTVDSGVLITGAPEVFEIGGPTHMAGITESGTVRVNVTVGEGE